MSSSTAPPSREPGWAQMQRATRQRQVEESKRVVKQDWNDVSETNNTKEGKKRKVRHSGEIEMYVHSLLLWLIFRSLPFFLSSVMMFLFCLFVYSYIAVCV